MPATSLMKDLKIGDVARMTGLTIDTVRFYEKERLLGTVRRNAGIRRYDHDAVRRLEFVRRAARLGFSLAEIRGLLSLRVSTRTSCEVVQQRAEAKLADLDARIAELSRMREALSQVASTCITTPATACPFLDALNQHTTDQRARSPRGCS
jgi:MerR family copper efflux transcriptional regulator